jgi:hypothetical protein
MTIAAPGEPYIDANGNGQYDSDEYFVDLTYPNAVGNSYAKHAMRRVVDGYTRQVPWKDAASDGKYTIGINFNGVFYTNGIFDAQGNWAYYGSVVTKGGMTGSAGTPDIYFDERLVSGAWPPPEIQLPRTMISAWETEN